MPAKPSELFDRDAEWSDLTAFTGGPTPGAALALVHGRRRQGKMLLFELLCEAVGGFMATGVEQSDAQNLAGPATAFTRFTRPGFTAALAADAAATSYVELVDLDQSLHRLLNPTCHGPSRAAGMTAMPSCRR